MEPTDEQKVIRQAMGVIMTGLPITIKAEGGVSISPDATAEELCEILVRFEALTPRRKPRKEKAK